MLRKDHSDHAHCSEDNAHNSFGSSLGMWHDAGQLAQSWRRCGTVMFNLLQVTAKRPGGAGVRDLKGKK